jgi:nucleotide-binding universal stress UspA family protein
MYNHVLIPVDGSELSEGALQAAIALAKRLDARLTAFYALPTAGAYAYANVPPFDGSFLTGSGARRHDEVSAL